jgi:tripartite motif-containing protein 2/3
MDMKPASDKILKQLEALKASIKGKIPDMKNYLRNLGEYMNLLNHQEKSIVENVQAHADMLHKMIDKSKVELLDSVQNSTKQEMASVEQKLKGMNHTLRGLTGNAEFLDIIMKHGKPDEVLFLYKQIADRLSRLLYIQTNPLLKKLAINFLPGTATEQNVELLFGRIHTAMRTVEKDGTIQNGPSKEMLHMQSILPSLTKVEQLMHFDASCDHDIKDIWPTGLAINESGEFIIVDRGNKRIKIYDKEGNFRTSIAGHGRFALDSPYDVTLLKNGNMVVTDYGKEDLKIFSSDGKFVNIIEGPFKHPRGITTNSKGHMIVLDCGRQQITIHDEDGTLKDTIKGKDEEGVEYFTDPYYVSVMQNDNIIVTDWAAPNIKVFSGIGECLASSGTYGIKADQLLQPYGVCTDEFGYIFIADNQNNRIHLLLPDGRFFKFLLTKLDGLWHPMAVAINKQGHLVVTEGLGKVKVFKYI